MSQEILAALHKRYATKVFDPMRKVSDEDLHIILESGRLAPSSIGLEPWKFIVVQKNEIRQAMRVASYDQTKVTDASHIVVIARRTDGAVLPAELVARAAIAQAVPESALDGLREMAENGVRRSESDLDAWLRAQTYIPLGLMIETAALLQIDTCPMEGFDAHQIDQILGLGERNLKTTTMLAIGYRGDDAAEKRAKVRRSFDEVVEFVR